MLSSSKSFLIIQSKLCGPCKRLEDFGSDVCTSVCTFCLGERRTRTRETNHINHARARARILCSPSSSTHGSSIHRAPVWRAHACVWRFDCAVSLFRSGRPGRFGDVNERDRVIACELYAQPLIYDQNNISHASWT